VKIVKDRLTPTVDTSSPRLRLGRAASAQRIADLAQRIALRLLVLVGVDLQGDREPGMPEDELCIAGRNSQILQQGSCRMAQMVEANHPKAVGVADAAEWPDQIPRLDRPASFSGEDQAVVLPGATELDAIGRLRIMAGLEGKSDWTFNAPAFNPSEWVELQFVIDGGDSPDVPLGLRAKLKYFIANPCLADDPVSHCSHMLGVSWVLP
jgi:hypothetical protein